MFSEQGRWLAIEPRHRPYRPGTRIAGRAVTVLSHPGDNLMIHACIEQRRAGDVFVAAIDIVAVEAAAFAVVDRRT